MGGRVDTAPRFEKIAEGPDAAPTRPDGPETARHARDTPATRPRHARDPTQPRRVADFFVFFIRFFNSRIDWVGCGCGRAGGLGGVGWVLSRLIYIYIFIYLYIYIWYPPQDLPPNLSVYIYEITLQYTCTHMHTHGHTHTHAHTCNVD